MALTRVQGTAKVIGTGTINVTLAAPPTIGNAIVVHGIGYGTAAGGAVVTDNRGNTYALAIGAISGSVSVGIFYCSKIVATGSPFTITLNKGSGDFIANAIEVSEVGSGLLSDKTSSQTGVTGTINTGSTAALVINNALVSAVHSIGTTQVSITVESVSPVWTEEFEHLSYAQIPGEADTRILTTALGTTQSCSWVDSNATTNVAAIAVFGKSEDFPTPATRISQNVIELLSQNPNPAARVSQNVVEILTGAVVAPPPSTETTQFIIIH